MEIATQEDFFGNTTILRSKRHHRARAIAMHWMSTQSFSFPAPGENLAAKMIPPHLVERITFAPNEEHVRFIFEHPLIPRNQRREYLFEVDSVEDDWTPETLALRLSHWQIPAQYEFQVGHFTVNAKFEAWGLNESVVLTAPFLINHRQWYSGEYQPWKKWETPKPYCEDLANTAYLKTLEELGPKRLFLLGEGDEES